MVWADDIYIFAHSPAMLAQTPSTLELLLPRAGLSLNPDKTQCTTSAEFEGHHVRCSSCDSPCMDRLNGLTVLSSQVSFTNASQVAVNHRISAAWKSFLTGLCLQCVEALEFSRFPLDLVGFTLSHFDQG